MKQLNEEVKIDNVTENIKKYKDYKILNPGGNKTALVLKNTYTKEEKKNINDRILNENTDIEQVGFLDKKNKILEMAGGEFCVNATRCAIWEILDGKEDDVELTVSGYKRKISGGIQKDKRVYVDMEINNNVKNIIEKKKEFNIVKLDGIVLLVIEEEKSKKYIEKLKNNEELAKNELKQLMIETEIDEKAIGIILLQKENNMTKINPIIWVKSIDTVYYETACGSGSLAIAIYKNYIEGIKEIEVLQPSGGIINIKINIDNDFLKNAIITGKVIEDK